MTASDGDFRVLEEAAVFDYPFSLIDRIWGELNTPYEPDDRLAELTPGQRAIYAIQWIRSEVLNGGFHQCFSNSTGYLMPEAIEGGSLLGSDDLQRVLVEAATIIGEPFPRDRDDRNARLDELTHEQNLALDACNTRFYALDDVPGTNLDTLFDNYVRSHPGDFYVDDTDDAVAAAALLAAARKVIDSRWGRDLDLAETLLRKAIQRAARAGDDTTAALAASLQQQIPFMRG